MSNLKIGDSAVPFALTGVDGAKHALDEYRGRRAIAIIFSCNHCPYVRAWEDRMVQIQADYAAKGVSLVAINANDAVKYPDDGFDQMKERARSKRFNFAYLRDEDQIVAKGYGAQRTPEVFLFDGDFKLRYHGVIDDNYDDPGAVKSHYLKEAIDAVLTGRLMPVSETMPIGCTIKWK